jgi:hypothetical protein
MIQFYTVCGNNAPVGHEEYTNGAWRQALEKQQNFSVWASVWGFYHVSVTQLLGEFFANTRIDATRWISKCVLYIWTIYDEMWNFRNTVRHEIGQETDATAHSIADRDIMELRNKAPAMRFLMIPERRIFNQTGDSLKSKPLRTKKKWIRDAQIILKKFYDAEETAQEVQLFRSYFSSKRARNSDDVQTTDVTKDGG